MFAASSNSSTGADGQTKVWISHANLPDTAGTTASHDDSSQNSSPRSKNANRSTPVGIDTPAVDAPQIMLASAATLSEQPSPIDHPLPSPFVDIQTASADASTQPILMNSGVPFPTSPRDVKRKRECTESYPEDLSTPSSLAFYCSPSHTATQPVPMSHYSGSYVFQHQAPTTSEPSEVGQLGVAMEDSFPYFFSY